MIQEYVHDIASQMKIELSQLTMVEGRDVGCLDAHLLNITSDGQQQSALVYQAELNKMHLGESCEQLEFRIRSALSHLQMKLKPGAAIFQNNVLLR